MDNFTLREGTPAAKRMVSNPDRETRGAKALAELTPGAADRVTAGVEWQSNQHTLRATMNQAMMPYESKPRMDDASFTYGGIFGERVHTVRNDLRVVSGVRADRWRARDERRTLALGTGPMAMAIPNPEAGRVRTETLPGGFARLEHDLRGGTAVHAGIGHVERFPDYWELFNREGESSPSAFDTRPEKTTQVDVGITHQAGNWNASLSMFAGTIEDYILIESNVARTAPARTISIARNVDARTMGLEAGLGYKLSTRWKADATLAYVRGENRTDGVPLSQQPPLEARFALMRETPAWSLAMLLRAVARQTRFDLNTGNIAGQDIGPSPGFAVFSLNGGYRLSQDLTLTAGVDNLFDRTYAEHVSRTGALIPGFLQTTRVNEPGRTAWAKVQYSF